MNGRKAKELRRAARLEWSQLSLWEKGERPFKGYYRRAKRSYVRGGA